MRPILLLLAGITVFAGCAMPRVIVLNDPLDARQHNDLGVSYQARGEYDLAIREYDRAAELDSDWGLPLVNRGNTFALRDRWPEAEASYRKALRREPDYAEAMNNLAWALLQQGQPDEALNWARKAAAAKPPQPEYLDTLADIYIELEETDAARQTLRRALALSPSPDVRKGLEDKLLQMEKSLETCQ